MTEGKQKRKKREINREKERKKCTVVERRGAGGGPGAVALRRMANHLQKIHFHSHNHSQYLTLFRNFR